MPEKNPELDGLQMIFCFKPIEPTCHVFVCTSLGIGPLIGHVELVPKHWVLSEKVVVESLTKGLKF